MPEGRTNHDVAIIGGGLAGLTLALQLRRALPQFDIVVLERNSLPPPLAAYKIGESTVEIGAHYLAETLGLADMLETAHLRKFGLRLFFGAGVHDDLSDADELGASRLLPAISYQIDRGRLEGDLVRVLRDEGVSVLDNCTVRDVSIGDSAEPHSVELRYRDEARRMRCRWLIDASSRVALLKRSLGIGKPSDHRMSAAWFRLDSPISVDRWSESESWGRRCNRPRRLSTNHLMGTGYWVWIIPLAGERTSIGIVADPGIHPLSSYSSFDKFCSWLSLHQPKLAMEVLDRRDTLMDFGFRKSLSRDCEEVWSRQHWALTGEAGVFTDPFYSPGSDFIGISNTFISDIIRREVSSGRITAHAAVYQQMYKSFFDSTMSLYEGQYAGFGDTRLMAVKTTWDYAYYWSVLTWLFFRNVMTDIDFLKAAQPQLIAMRTLNETMQAKFRTRAAERRQDTGRGRFIDQAEIPVLYDLNAGLLRAATDPMTELDENCSILEGLSPLLLDVLAGSGGRNHCSLLGDLRQRLD